MRSLWYLPLTFLAGAHGFALFAPYLAIVFAALHLRSRHPARLAPAAAVKSRLPALVAVPSAVALPA